MPRVINRHTRNETFYRIYIPLFNYLLLRIHLYLNVLVETNETKNILNLYLAVAVAGQNGNGAPRNRGDEQEQFC